MIQNELVQVNKGEVFTTSKIIAEKLEVPHLRVLKLIERIILKQNEIYGNLDIQKCIPKFTQKFIKTQLEHGKTKIKYDGYLINEPAFIKIVMNLGSFDKAFIVQDEITKAFFQMKEILQNQSNNSWIEARENGKVLRKEETDIIKQLTEYAEKEKGSKLNYPLYSTYTKMTNKYLQFIVDIKEGKPIRDLSSIRDLGFIGIVDDRVKDCIINGMERKLPYKEIYQLTKDEVNKLCEILDFKKRLN